MTDLALIAPVDYSFELVVGSDILAIDSTALSDAMTSARRVLVISDDTAGRAESLIRDYLAHEQSRGRLDEFVVRDASDLADRAELEAIERLAEWALSADLARRDVFVALGSATTLHLTAVAASTFRRYTPCVRVLSSVSQVVSALHTGVHARRSDGAVGASPRRASYLVEAGALQVPVGDPAPLLLAVLDPLLASRLASSPVVEWGPLCADSITRVGRRFGPGHEVWTLGRQQSAGAEPFDQLLHGIEIAERSGLCGSARAMTLRSIAIELGAAPILAAETLEYVELLVPTDVGCAVLAGGRPRRLSAEAEADSLPARTEVLSYRSTIHKRMGVKITADLWSDADTVRSMMVGGSPGSRLLVAMDDFDPRYTRRVLAALDGARSAGAVSDYKVVFLEPTDRRKNHEQTRRLVDIARDMRLTPDDQVAAIGGGTVLDITGYAVSLLSPTVPYIRIPTSLVGMIDAAVGLKVGVNLGRHKNLCGAYHPANLTICDLRPLETLPVVETRCGLAEAAKIAIVCDAELFELLNRHSRQLADGTLDAQPLIEVVSRSIRAMTGELRINPLEENLRRLPDFGHELGHLFESMTGYQLRHGEAVAIGLAMSTCIGYAARRTSRLTRDRILSLIASLGLSLWNETCDPHSVYHHLTTEVVANKGGRLHLVIPTSIGSGGYIDSADELTYAHVNTAMHQVKTYCA